MSGAGWLDLLRADLRRDEAFYAQMDAQLGAAFLKVVGEPITRFKLYPPGGMFTLEPRGQMFTVEQHGETFALSGGLLDIDTMFEIRLAWRAAGGGYEFWWLDLPAADIREMLDERRAPFADVDFVVPVTVRNPAWPDVTLALEIGSDADRDALETAIAAAIEEWNSGGNDGVVHRAGPVEEVAVDRLAVALDMGSASIDFLQVLLGRLSALGVRAVTLDS